MTIGTFNINWGKKQLPYIEETLHKLNLDILIITEGVNLNLPAYDYVYKSKDLSNYEEYEGINYKNYSKTTSINRVIIYSKYQSSRSFKVIDPFTSICNQFNTEFGTLTIYGTIIGTQFKTPPYAEKELHNCINDCMRIYNQTQSLCLAGDLNTSFQETEKMFQINSETTKLLKELCNLCELDLTTQDIKENIDHIFLPKTIATKFQVLKDIFIGKNLLSDHQGIRISIKEKYIS